MKSFVNLIILLSITGAAFSQADCACCTEHHKQFNFWIGEWNVYDTLGNKVGENSIVKLEDDCIVNEHWRGTQGSSGRSYNYYDPSDSTWNQVWIDNNGGNLMLKGKAEKNKMTLTSVSLKEKKINSNSNRITWTKNKNGTVTQVWEILDKDKQVIKVAFYGIYQKKLAYD